MEKNLLESETSVFKITHKKKNGNYTYGYIWVQNVALTPFIGKKVKITIEEIVP